MAARTDLTQDIDGAFAQRNVGNKHWSECARSGNGNMMNDLLDEDSIDYQEYDGVGESMEALTPEESAAVDGLGQLAGFAKFRWPKAGELPPVNAAPGKVWLRRRVITGTRLPGGQRMAKVKWAQVNKTRLHTLQKSGQMHGMGDFSTMGIASSVGLGLAGGLLLWFGIRALKKR